MLKNIHYAQYLPQALAQLPSGAFLTARNKQEINTMTIGWGSIGIHWSLPVFTVLVRYSRHTYSLLEQTPEFSVSFPLDTDLKASLAFCGTRSGRDVDKFKECNLTAEPAQKISVPVIAQCQLHYECQVVYRQAMEPGVVAAKIRQLQYKNHDYHVLFHGEIVSCYLTEGDS